MTTYAGSEPAVAVRDLCKSFATLDATIRAADHVDLDIARGSTTALMGPSGSGKSTLLHLVGALDRPDSGTITVLGTEITALRDKELPAYRRSIGFVFQRFHLLPTLTVLDNVLAPRLARRLGPTDRERAEGLLADLGLAGRENTLATRLSGGQQQRVAIARALLHEPQLLLCDEPTGNLDHATGEEIVELLFGIRDRRGTTVVIATHDPELARRCDVTVHVTDGRVATVPVCG